MHIKITFQKETINLHLKVNTKDKPIEPIVLEVVIRKKNIII